MSTHESIRPDPRNPNRGTARGRKQVRESLTELGAGRSIVTDKHGVIVAGNQTFSQASALDMPVRVIETDGSELIAVRRTDLDLEDDPRARKLSYADNRAGETGLDWDVAVVMADAEAGIDLSALFADTELAELYEASEATTQRAAATGESAARTAGPVVFKPVLAVVDEATLERALAATGQVTRGDALLVLCRSYLEQLSA